MERILNFLSLVAMALLVFLSMAVVITRRGTAQTTGCSGYNACDPFNSNGGNSQCVQLYCSGSHYFPESCDLQTCFGIPGSCGTGSYWEQDKMTCKLQNQAAETRYYCASTNLDVLKSAVGPGRCPDTPCDNPGTTCQSDDSCCPSQFCGYSAYYSKYVCINRQIADARCQYVSGSNGFATDYGSYPVDGCE